MTARASGLRFTFGKKLGTSFGVILALAVLGSTISYIKLAAVIQDVDATFELRFPSSEAINVLQRDMNMTSVKARQAIQAGSQPDRREVAQKAWEKTWGTVAKDLVTFDALAPKWVLQTNRDRLAEIKQRLTVLHDAQQEAIGHAVGDRDDVIKAGNEYTDRGTSAAEAVRQTTEAMSDSFHVLLEKNKADVHAASRALKMTLGATTLSALGFGIVAAIVLSRRTASRLKRLTQMIQDIAEGEGDITRRLEASVGFGNDELGEVSRFFNFSWTSSRKSFGASPPIPRSSPPPVSSCWQPVSRSLAIPQKPPTNPPPSLRSRSRFPRTSRAFRPAPAR